MLRASITALTLVGAAALTPHAAAQASSGGSVSLTGGPGGVAADGKAGATGPTEGANKTPTAPTPESYLTRYKPVPHLFELGIYGGLFFPSGDHNLLDPGSAAQVPFDSPSAELGLRFGYFPFSFAGVEVEGSIMPSGTEDGGSAALAAVRGHVVAQLPLYSIVPFAVLGAGMLGAGSDAMGEDVDPALHFGVGVKAPLDDYLSVRLDVRDNLSQKTLPSAQGSLTHHPEILLGLTVTLDRNPPPPAPPADEDGDGVVDDKDACPKVAAKTADGCPPKPDLDQDGIPDAEDDCRREAGPAPTGCPAKTPCPPPPPPDPDADGDGISGDADQCPGAKETENGYKDDDGCPDELPAAIKKFDGAIQGIRFAAGSSVVLPGSYAVLDETVKVLEQYPNLRLAIVGHTDDSGDHDANVKLSLQRAEAVKAYMVKKGVDDSRLTAVGKGPDEPVGKNDTPDGRARNRRIEFHPIAHHHEAGKHGTAPKGDAPAPAAPKGDAPAAAAPAE